LRFARRTEETKSCRQLLAGFFSREANSHTGHQDEGEKDKMDTVITNGRVIDPASGFDGSANIGIERGKIARITRDNLVGARVIDAAGKAVAPGFIDIHMHEGENENTILDCMARMGVTTAIGGNCGYSAYPTGAYYTDLEAAGLPINYTGFVGYITLREAVGLTDRYAPAGADQRAAVAELIRAALAAGAIGLSFGHEYAPGVTGEEALAAAAVVAEYPGRLLSAHFRFDADRAVESVKELAELSLRSGVPMQLSHIGSCAGFPQIMADSLTALEAAQAAGVDIMADCYPYNAFSTAIGSAVFDEGCFERWGKTFSCIMVAEGEHVGQYCDAALFARLRAEAPATRVIGFVMHEAEIVRALQHPLVLVGSDGAFHNRQGHPRGAGAFPRVLGRLVREQPALTLTEALAKMTVLPAERLGLRQKGRIAVGADADLTLFDPEIIIDKADFDCPTAAPAGVGPVLVGGEVVAEAGELTGSKPGKVIRY